MVNAINVNNSMNSYSCGDIRRIGTLPDGRIAYSVFDSKGKEAQRLSVPNDEADIFESSYGKIINSAPKIKKYVAENSSDEDLRRRRTYGRNVIATFAAVGAAAPVMLLWNSASVTKKILGTIGGVVAGLAAGLVASLCAMTPPGTAEFIKAHRELSKLDIRTIEQQGSAKDYLA